MPRWSRKLYCQSNGQVHFRISIFITMNIFLMSISEVHIPIINYILVEPGLCGIIVQPEAGLSAPPGPSAEISPVIIIWADIKHNTHWHQSLPGYISNELMSTGMWYYQVMERDGICWKVCLSFRSTESTLLKKNTQCGITKLAFTPDTVTHRGHICYCPWHVTLSVCSPWLTLVTSPSQPLSQPSPGPAQPHQGQGGLCPSTLSTLHVYTRHQQQGRIFGSNSHSILTPFTACCTYYERLAWLFSV